MVASYIATAYFVDKSFSTPCININLKFSYQSYNMMKSEDRQTNGFSSSYSSQIIQTLDLMTLSFIPPGKAH